MPKTGELDSRRLGLAFLPDHHFVKEPATASPPTIVTNTHPVYLTQGHGLNEELVMLEDRGREKRVKCGPFSRIKLISWADDLTLPFSNLLTLFLLIIMRRSPVSPRSPITLRKTLASVPLPLTLPVQMVMRYFITETDKGRQIHT